MLEWLSTPITMPFWAVFGLAMCGADFIGRQSAVIYSRWRAAQELKKLPFDKS